MRDPSPVGEGTRSFPDGIVPGRPGPSTTPQPFVLPADPPQQVGVDAFQEGIQGRSVERPIMVHPTPDDRVYPIGEVLLGQACATVQPPRPHLGAISSGQCIGLL